MDMLFQYVEDYTGVYGVWAGVLVGLVLGLMSCAMTLVFYWLVGK